MFRDETRLVNQDKFNYILDTFTNIYDVKRLPLQLAYGLDGRSRVQIRASSWDGEVPVKIGDVHWKQWQGQRVPLFFADAERELLTERDGQVIINYDIAATSFYFLSGVQESLCPHRDQFGRFRLCDSLQHQLGMTAVPVVNYYFDILRVAIERAYGTEVKRHECGTAAFTTCITHDIDKCHQGWLEGGLAQLKQGELFSFLKLLGLKLLGRDVWFNFDEILKILSHHKAISSFYFLASSEKYNGLLNADYDIASRRFQNVLTEIEQLGCEIGIHGSLGTHGSSEALARDISRLGRAVRGNRFHFLKFEVTRTPEVLEETGLMYDTTLAFAEESGFRNGFCFPFYLYDICKDRPTTVLEIPLNLMDTTLHHPDYLHIKPTEVGAVAEGLIREVKRFGGCFTFLWHNTHFSPYKYAGWRQAFADVVNLCQQHGSQFRTVRDVAAKFTRREGDVKSI